MTRSHSLRHAVCAAALFGFLPFAALAQSAAKPPPRLPPNASETSRIPAGVDTGTPATSDALQLGTPIPPAGGADRSDLRTRSAAARAAARPKPTASGADCTRAVADGAQPGTEKGALVAVPKRPLGAIAPRPVAPNPVASGATRIDC